MLRDLLRRWLGRPEAVRTRLSYDEAVAIAREAARGHQMAEELQMTVVNERAGRPIWTVTAAVIGSNLVVEIDDETGQVLEVRRVPGR